MPSFFRFRLIGGVLWRNTADQMADDRRGSITSAASGESVRNIDDEGEKLLLGSH